MVLALGLLAIALPSVALAAAPSAQTFDANATGPTTATVDGSVNPGGQSTTYQVQYDLQGSTWCSSFGSSGSATYTTLAQTLGATDTSITTCRLR